MNAAASVTICLPKCLDSYTSPYLMEDIDQKMQAGGTLILDMRQTRSISPESTYVIGETLLKSYRKQTKLKLRGVCPQVEVALKLTGILQHFRSRPVAVP
ncbi:MAG: hypothetical protein F6K19_48885 [Cyanothece sp. SIO1E1]|nr:hypothetical protein [Cyanothece sp. SIO1E1]